MSDIEKTLENAHHARLIPTIADPRKEERLVSILLATLAVVPPFAKQLLGQCGVPVGKRSKLLSYTEVKFPSSDGNNSNNDEDRPDGVLTLSTGKSLWRALVEAKIDNVEIDQEQILKYAKIARDYKIDAVITLSNQLTPLPTHIPYSVPNLLRKRVNFFHISWVSVLTQALLILEDKEEISNEQAYILGEMTHYFKHPKSGVKGFEQMNKEWKSLVAGMIHGDKFSKSSLEIQNTVSSWHQEERDICLLLSRKIGKHVDIRLPLKHQKDPALRLSETCDSLITSHELRSSFSVPNAASNIEVTANLEGRSISCSMKLDAPGDRKKASARINWLLRQLRDVDGNNVIVRAFWPGKTPPTRAPLSEIRKDTRCLEVERPGATPTSFEVRMNKDLVGGFSKPRNFIKDLEEFVPDFYDRIGQRLRRWVPPPPPIDKHDPIEEPPATKATEESSGRGLETSPAHGLPASNDTNTRSTEYSERII
ncbi:MAG: hypothetical protein OXE44_19160 [Nitrospinae bacterium]|nr:hypothetical protein [Nitrospinota bacterium]